MESKEAMEVVPIQERRASGKPPSICTDILWWITEAHDKDSNVVGRVVLVCVFE